MNFHLEFNPRPFAEKITHRDKLLLIGSCFTENIGTKLKQHKFSVLENPNGILFNPVSIAKSVVSYVHNIQYTEADLFYQNEAWNSWQHHTRFSHPDKAVCLQQINTSQTTAHGFVNNTNWLLITVGSAFVYELESREVVANCHKVPTDKFTKRLLGVDEIKTVLLDMLSEVFKVNNGVKIIFTISPVRHLRDGFVENNRSKATLINAIHQMVDADERLFYFPAYELVIDDLRDYRFYAEDMVHPNYAATNYVWEKFIATCIEEPSQLLMKEINAINAAKSHKPFNPTSHQHQQFLLNNFEKVVHLEKKFPYINFEEEKMFFNKIDRKE